MADSGWYPDPGGAPGRYRFWDGSTWSSETTDNPYAPPPGQQPPGGRSAGKRRTGLLIGVLAVLVVLILVVVFAVRSLTDDSGAITDPAPPRSSVSGWDDSSPLPTASPTPSKSPKPSKSAKPQSKVSCDVGDPTERQPHPTDGRIYGGDLSFSKPSGYDPDQSYTWSMDWAYDTDGVSVETEPLWASLMAVGYVKDADGFHTPEQSAEGMMQCIASSGYYSGFTGRRNVFSRAVTVDGKQGWALRSEIRVDNEGLSVEGDVAEVIVVDTGTAGQLSFFAGFVPIGDDARIRALDDTIDGLQAG